MIDTDPNKTAAQLTDTSGVEKKEMAEDDYDKREGVCVCVCVCARARARVCKAGASRCFSRNPCFTPIDQFTTLALVVSSLAPS